MSSHRTSSDRHRRLLIRGLPLAALSAAAFVLGAAIAAGSPELDAARSFGSSWAVGDYEAMHAQLNEASRADYSVESLRDAYETASATATVERITVGKPDGPTEQGGESVVSLPVTILTKAFGEISGEVQVPVSDGGIVWNPSLTFPGLHLGEHLAGKLTLGSRGPILDRDRKPIAEGPAGARVVDPAAAGFVGSTGMPEGELAEQLVAAGFPEDTMLGITGLELAFNSTLAGTPGGRLFAVGENGRRVLAEDEPDNGKAVRTTIDMDLQRTAVAALGDRFAGAAALDARSGAVRALAGVAFSAPQPPGSTFKIVTVTGALNEGVTELSEEFPVATSATVGGREISNAYDESCGGDLIASFAHSCNSVFAPLGARLGGEALHDTAVKFGFNEYPTLYSPEALALTQPPISTIPDDITDELDAAVSAIGQGQVLATPLAMASVAQTIANRGIRSPTSIVYDDALAGGYEDVVVAEPKVAKDVRKLMVAAVNLGTGGAAALPGVQVAGKTGTAELGTSSGEVPAEGEDPELDVNAWFTAFAPAEKPKLAVAVMIVNASGDGGTVAAPIARQILAASLTG